MLCGVAVHDGDDKDGWLDSKFSALNSLPMNLKLRAIICVMVFLVEVFFVISDVLLKDTVKTFDDTASVSLVDLVGLDYLAKTKVYTQFWKRYHYIYLLSVSIYVLTIYQIGEHFLHRARNRMDAIHRSNAVVRLGLDGIVIEANHIFCAMLGYTKEQVVGEHHRKLIHKHLWYSEEYEAFWDSLRGGFVVTGLFERVDAHGRRVYLRGTYHPITNQNGEVYEVLKIATNETARVEAQISLKNANTYLEHAAKILRHDMHSGINTYIPRAVKSLDRRLSEYPEIKEELSMPLKMLRGGLEHTQRVYRGVRAFTDLVREGVPLEREDHDLQQILEDYLENTAYSSSVLIEPLVTASVNDALFCTAIDNFIRNGLKYNDSHSKMVVVKMVANNVIAIIDNGRGMSQEDFEKYAKPYVRKQGQSESGSGLGLNISLAILQEHGFTVSSEKQEAGGTKILVRLS